MAWQVGGVDRLKFFCRSGADDWAGVVSAYWRGALNGLELVHSSRFAVVERGSVSAHPRPCYFKRLRPRNRRDIIKQWIRGSRASRAVEGAQLLAALGFETPEAVCVVEERSFGLVGGSALVTEEVAEALTVRDWLKEARGGELRRRLRLIAKQVGSLHRAGVHHGDMNLGNILVREEEGAVCFFWVDTERIRRYRVVPLRLRIDNLRQLNKESDFLSGKDRLAFFLSYRRSVGLGLVEAKKTLRGAAVIIDDYWRHYGTREPH